jgi:hypothetical protein
MSFCSIVIWSFPLKNLIPVSKLKQFAVVSSGTDNSGVNSAVRAIVR